jgi:tetratricopeptide (TPR) repeat protein
MRRILIGLALVLVAFPAWAQNTDAQSKEQQKKAEQAKQDAIRAENWAQCTSDDPDLRISGCSAIIERGSESMISLSMAYNNRGIAYNSKHLYDKAIADYTTVMALSPNNAGVFINRAWAYHLEGRDTEALPDANKAVDLAPRSASIIETRAEIHEKLGQRDQAIEDYRAALRLDPDDGRSQQGLQRLGVAP